MWEQMEERDSFSGDFLLTKSVFFLFYVLGDHEAVTNGLVVMVQDLRSSRVMAQVIPCRTGSG